MPQDENKPNRFNPLPPLLDALIVAFVATGMRIFGFRGKYKSSASPTLDVFLLLDLFLETWVVFFFCIYLLRLLGIYTLDYGWSFCGKIRDKIRGRN
jgi:hypothetical protein